MNAVATARVPVLADAAPVHVAIVPAHAAATDLADSVERRAAGAMGPRRGVEFLRGRSLLRALAGRVLGPAAATAPVRTTDRGKPVLDHEIPVDVSISHTDGYVAAALWSDGQVGVDVAETGELNPRLVRRCCGEHADAVLARGDSAAFARVWAVQEACVKATGLGLAGIPWRIPVDPGRRHGGWRELRWRVLDTGAPCVVALAVRPDPTTRDQEDR